MKSIKKLYILLSSVAVALSLTGCYKDYVQDFDYSGAYLAYQYDLRGWRGNAVQDRRCPRGSDEE